jgi:hypothetical protein
MRLKAAIMLLVLAQAGNASALTVDCRPANGGHDLVCQANGSDGVAGEITIQAQVLANHLAWLTIRSGKCGAPLVVMYGSRVPPNDWLNGVSKLAKVGAGECTEAVLERCTWADTPQECDRVGRLKMLRR